MYVVYCTSVFRIYSPALATVVRISLVQNLHLVQSTLTSSESKYSESRIFFLFLVSQSQLSLIIFCKLNKQLVHKIILYYNFVIINTPEVNSCRTNLVPTKAYSSMDDKGNWLIWTSHESFITCKKNWWVCLHWQSSAHHTWPGHRHMAAKAKKALPPC
jgi:hypothetical protein